MKILALIGSPRKGSNTDILVDEILKGSRVTILISRAFAALESRPRQGLPSWLETNASLVLLSF
jgi:hypothetical protein